MLPKFEVYIPKGVDDSLRFLDENKEKALILAGGTDLLLRVRSRGVKPEWLIDISGFEELKYIKKTDGIVRIGALTLVDELARSEDLKDCCAVFCEVAEKFGGPHTRNLATIGGNVARCLQTSDLILPLIALNAGSTVRSFKGERHVPVEDLLIGRRKTSLEPNEIITEFSFKEPEKNEYCAYEKLGRRKALAITIASACVFLRLGENGERIDDVRVVVDQLSNRRIPERSKKTEAFLRGKAWSDKVITDAEEVLSGEMHRRGDFRASAEYRADMSKVLFRRALKKCRENIVAKTR